MKNWTPLRTHIKKEVARFMSIWGQAILAPVISTVLYLIIFGVSLGSRIEAGGEHGYLSFMIPGLIMIGLITNSAINATFSIFLAKLNGYIFDVLVAPISYLEMAIGYIAASTLRGLVVGLVIYAVGFYYSGLVPFSIGFTLLVALLTGWCFSAIGCAIAVWAKDFDQLGIFTNFFLTPLIFLGGVFYSIDVLPPFWQGVSKFNPLLYMIDAFRYGFLGVSDVNPFYSLGFLSLMTVISTAILFGIFRSGWKLRS